MKYNFLVNPISGNGKSKKTMEIISGKLNGLNIPFSVYYSGSRGHLTELAKQVIDEGADNIIAVGGDGTLNEVLNGFHSFDKCALGIIPSGSGNDFAVSAKIPENPLEALDIILKNEPRFTDFLQTSSGIRGLNIIGTGIDVDVLRRYNAKKKKNKAAYRSALITSLIKFKPYKFTAFINGEEKQYQCFMAAAGNGVQYGSGVKMCPKAVIDDGLIDFVVIRKLAKIKIPLVFKRLFKGTILEIKQADFFRSEKVAVTSEEPFDLNLDGELYSNIKFEVECVHDVLRMYR